MRLRLRSGLSVPKDANSSFANEDYWVANDELQRYAVSDGASESYAGGVWSRALCEFWTLSGQPGRLAVLREAIGRYTRQCNPDSLTWSRRAAYDRNSYATLLGLQARGGMARALAIGDSLLIVGLRSGVVVTFPFASAEHMPARPTLVATDLKANRPWMRRDRVRHLVTRFPLDDVEAVLLVTDALARWVLRQPNRPAAIEKLWTIPNQDEFRAFVLRARAAGTMPLDDTTLLQVEVVRA